MKWQEMRRSYLREQILEPLLERESDFRVDLGRDALHAAPPSELADGRLPQVLANKLIGFNLGLHRLSEASVASHGVPRRSSHRIKGPEGLVASLEWVNAVAPLTWGQCEYTGLRSQAIWGEWVNAVAPQTWGQCELTGLRSSAPGGVGE